MSGQCDGQVIVFRAWWSSRRIWVWAVTVCVIATALVIQILIPGTKIVPESLSPLGAGVALGVFLAAMICEYVDSALGMGYGTTLTPLLLLAGFEPLQIVPAVLFSEFLTGAAAGILHHRDGNADLLRDRSVRRTAALLSLLSVVGTLGAVAIALRASKELLTLMIGGIVLMVGVLILATVRRQLRYRPWHIVLLGGVAAFNKALSGGGYGPLVTGGQVVSGVPARSAVAITSVAECLTCLVGLIVYFAAQKSLYWPLVLPLVLGALLSVPLATLTVKRVPETLLRGSVGVTTVGLGLLMLAKGIG